MALNTVGSCVEFRTRNICETVKNYYRLRFSTLLAFLSIDLPHQPPCSAGIQLMSQQISDAAAGTDVLFGCNWHVYQVTLISYESHGQQQWKNEFHFMLSKLVQLQLRMLKTNYCWKMTSFNFSRYTSYILYIWWTKGKTLVIFLQDSICQSC